LLPRSLPLLIPDLFSYTIQNSSGEQGALNPEDLLFFDLETTGLSGGAGTVAFLAAFGRFVRDAGEPPQPYRLHIDQYLLLDYPGESDFLEALVQELGQCRSPDRITPRPLIVVTYNGKSFDAQILKNRCIMQGITPPVYPHADLLHPARRLWKRILSTCSQGEIETTILGLNRIGDVPGALAPEIWFSFLRLFQSTYPTKGDSHSVGPKSGAVEALLKVCDHNQRDILGLASLFTAFTHIAEAPLKAVEQFHYDLENLALSWQKRVKHSALGEEAEETGQALLETAAAQGYPRAALMLGLDLMRQNRRNTGRVYLLELTKGHYPDAIKAVAYRSLAIDAEWHIQDREAALAYLDAGLNLEELREGMKRELLLRRERVLARGTLCIS
jgi:uncharacterized protein YprB with RNaseH-like and TPR domain